MIIYKIVDEEYETRWDAFVDSLKGGPYLYFAWKKALERAYNHNGLYFLAEKSGEVVGILPLVAFKGFLKKTLISLPFCDYGGPLAQNEEISQSLLLEAQKFVENALWTNELEVRFSEPPPFLPSEKGKTDKVRLILELPSSSETLWKALKAKVRSQVRRPTKDGVKALLGGVELLPAFYRVYLENMHYLGSPPHTLKWFKEIFLAYGARAKVGLVHWEGEPLAGGILLCSSDTAVVPWASSRRQFKKLSPNMLLYWTFLSYAADQGFRYFDFGRSTPGSGTYRFKKQWGAQEVPLYWYSPYTSSNFKETSFKFRSLIEDIWRRLPFSLVNYFGPYLRSRIPL